MSTAKVKSVDAFEFRSDFGPPAPPPAPQDDRISISVSELAALLDDTRQSTERMVRDRGARMRATAMTRSSDSLRVALLQIVELAQALENATISESLREEAKARVRKIAAELIDGQGNLFQSAPQSDKR